MNRQTNKEGLNCMNRSLIWWKKGMILVLLRKSSLDKFKLGDLGKE